MDVIEGTGKPIKIWAKNLEDEAIGQITRLSLLPFVFKHVAIMPDCHSGYGMPIGGVLATKGVIIPNAVGVDIGCGVQAFRTTATEITQKQIEAILLKCKETIPVGFNHHSIKQELDTTNLKGIITTQEMEKLYYSIGTLGGGNHFLELQVAEDGHVWAMVHTGSRNLGKQICDHYNGIAKELNSRFYSSVDTSWDLSFLPLKTDEAYNYIEDMNSAILFAKENRTRILDVVEKILIDTLKCETSERIDTKHNYAEFEHHFQYNVMVHRKGAIRVDSDTCSIIPGSMGTSSYIVTGLDNKDSFMSASHGAGRRFSRTQANRVISDIEAKESMEGITYLLGSEDRSEFPAAYKDIEEVMDNQKDLVRKITKLTPIGVLKG